MQAEWSKEPWRHILSRAWRGIRSATAVLTLPLGGWWPGGAWPASEPTRFTDGLAIVLPGVEGRGSLNRSVAQGLDDAGFPGAIVVHDWTTGFWPLFPFHLRARRRNRQQARAIADRVLAYQNAYPGRPVYLVGHSGGATIAVWVLEALPEGRTVTAAALLAPALSPGYSLATALRRVERVLWSFWSPLDLLMLAAGTLLFGTVDGRHVVSAGCVGFSAPKAGDGEESVLYRDRLRQRRYTPTMVRQFHLGGHFGWANRVHVAETVAPLLFGRGNHRSLPLAG